MTTTQLEPVQASPDYAEQRFHFLSALGFSLDERWISGGVSFRDGWRLAYSSAGVGVTISYLDMQLEIVFARAGVSADYWFIDRELFARRSGFHGNMFPVEKLPKAIDLVSADVRAHYGPVLAGDDALWGQIRSAMQAPQRKGRLP